MSEGKARPSRIKPETIEREAEVLKLRRGGLTFDLIAQKLGFANASGAHKAYANACKRIIRADVEELRGTELDRLDVAQSALWNKVLGGEVSAVMALLKIMERRARLLGLDMPARAQVEITHYDASTIDTEVQRLVELLDSGKTRALDAPTRENGADSN